MSEHGSNYITIPSNEYIERRNSLIRRLSLENKVMIIGHGKMNFHEFK